MLHDQLVDVQRHGGVRVITTRWCWQECLRIWFRFGVRWLLKLVVAGVVFGKIAGCSWVAWFCRAGMAGGRRGSGVAGSDRLVCRFLWFRSSVSPILVAGLCRSCFWCSGDRWSDIYTQSHRVCITKWVEWLLFHHSNNQHASEIASCKGCCFQYSICQDTQQTEWCLDVRVYVETGLRWIPPNSLYFCWKPSLLLSLSVSHHLILNELKYIFVRERLLTTIEHECTIYSGSESRSYACDSLYIDMIRNYTW